MVLFISYNLQVLLIAGILTAPFYFFNKYLQQKVNPRGGGKKLLLYLGILLCSLFIYITGGVFLIVGIAKLLQ
jgi:hypothetical protein